MHRNELKALHACYLGLIPYDLGALVQAHFHKLVATGQMGPCMLLLEHTPVITFGKSTNSDYLKASKGLLHSAGIDLCMTDRGGQVTAHTPGQLVVYPIIPLRQLGLGVKAYVSLLEQAVINLLQSFDVRCHRDQEHPGVWYGNSKVCALGIRVKDRVSMHGLALNVKADLSIFSYIVPCGIEGRTVVNLESLTNSQLPIEGIAKLLASELAKLLKLEMNYHTYNSEPNKILESNLFG